MSQRAQIRGPGQVSLPESRPRGDKHKDAGTNPHTCPGWPNLMPPFPGSLPGREHFRSAGSLCVLSGCSPNNAVRQGPKNVPILQIRRLRTRELESSVPKVARPLGGNLYLAFHPSIPPPAFKALLKPPRPGSPPFLSPEAVKPTPTSRLSLGLGNGRKSQPVYVPARLSNCTEQPGPQWTGSPCSSGPALPAPPKAQGRLSSQLVSWRKGRGLPGLSRVPGVGRGE